MYVISLLGDKSIPRVSVASYDSSITTTLTVNHILVVCLSINFVMYVFYMGLQELVDEVKSKKIDYIRY